jgi:TatD DNase family protein
VAETARVLAEVKGLSVEAIAKATTDNFYRVFTKIERPA